MTHRALFVDGRPVTPARIGGAFSMRYLDDRENAGQVAVLLDTELTPRDLAERLAPGFGETQDVTAWSTAILQELLPFAGVPSGTSVRVLPHGRLVAEFHDEEVFRSVSREWADHTRHGLGALPVLGYRRDTGWFVFAVFHWPDAWSRDSAPPRLVDAGELLEWARSHHPATFGDAERVVLA